MLDWGGLCELSVRRQELRVGIMLQNIPTKLKFTDELESVPFNLKAGMAWLPPWIRGLTLSMDVNMPMDAQPDIYTGAEYWIKDIFALRTGYKYQSMKNGLGSLSNLAGGLGFRIRRYQLDYAFVPRGALGNNTHMFSLGAGF